MINLGKQQCIIDLAATYISQLIRFARVYSHVDDFTARNKG